MKKSRKLFELNCLNINCDGTGIIYGTFSEAGGVSQAIVKGDFKISSGTTRDIVSLGCKKCGRTTYIGDF